MPICSLVIVPFERRVLREYLRLIVGALREFVLGKKKRYNITIFGKGNSRLGELNSKL